MFHGCQMDLYQTLQNAVTKYVSSGCSEEDLKSELDSVFDGDKELTAYFLKSFLVHREYSVDISRSGEVSAETNDAYSFDLKEAISIARNYSWTTNNALGIVHGKPIGLGGSGEVHEVLPLL